MAFSHKSVLLCEAVDALNVRPDGIYLDGTLGGAGHSREICRRLTTGTLVGVDRDETALQAAAERLAEFGPRAVLVHGNFENLEQILDSLHLTGADGMLFDLGVSSYQLDDAARGFSYMAGRAAGHADGPRARR
jgi:16S rRNA (cytosine1402-N4)-methyltransferase